MSLLELQARKNFNRVLALLKIIVEKTIGMVKLRFRLTKEKIRVKKLSKLRVYILTAMILHNF